MKALFVLLLLTGTAISGPGQTSSPTKEYCEWEMVDFAINESLCGLEGDPVRGQAVAADSYGGNCLACHQFPMPEEPLHGTVGPPLHALASRMTEAQIRAHVVDQHRFNPTTIMPAFYVIPNPDNRVADQFWGKPFLSAQQVEDIVAYLKTLR